MTVLTRNLEWIGKRAIAKIAVVQFGFAIILPPVAGSDVGVMLISGMTRGTSTW